VSLCEAEPMATGFPYSCTMVKIQSTRTEKKTGRSSLESRYYLSSQQQNERTPERWINLSREHWAGVENRNHWRRDASLGEDGTRSRNGKALINLALIRSANLRLLSHAGGNGWLPAQKEHLAANPTSAMALLRAKL
jgi:predicted transposase YbfD/YdcC